VGGWQDEGQANELITGYDQLASPFRGLLPPPHGLPDPDSLEDSGPGAEMNQIQVLHSPLSRSLSAARIAERAGAGYLGSGGWDHDCH
jgi:hypothetical protein